MFCRDDVKFENRLDDVLLRRVNTRLYLKPAERNPQCAGYKVQIEKSQLIKVSSAPPTIFPRAGGQHGDCRRRHQINDHVEWVPLSFGGAPELPALPCSPGWLIRWWDNCSVDAGNEFAIPINSRRIDVTTHEFGRPAVGVRNVWRRIPLVDSTGNDYQDAHQQRQKTYYPTRSVDFSHAQPLSLMPLIIQPTATEQADDG